MTLIVDALTLVFLAVGVLFFTAGTVGLIRFPDVRLRLHALTKADNLGLGFILLAVALQAPSPLVGLVFGVTWAVTLASASVAARIIAGRAAADTAASAADAATAAGSAAPNASTASLSDARPRTVGEAPRWLRPRWRDSIGPLT